MTNPSLNRWICSHSGIPEVKDSRLHYEVGAFQQRWILKIAQRKIYNKLELPDGLAWGRIQGYETLFWLEGGDEHKSRKQIEGITQKRLDEAWKFCQETGIRLVYTQLSVRWVQDAARWACVNLPEEVAVVLGNIRKFGELPIVEWGRTIPV